MAGNPISFSCSAATALSTTYAAAEIGEVTGTDAKAEALPGACYLWRLEGTLTAIAGAASVTWYLSKDAAGDKPLTPEATVTILDADASGAGSVNTVIQTAIPLDSDSSGSRIWAHAKTDAGTASMVARLIWELR